MSATTHTYIVDRECPVCNSLVRITKTKSRLTIVDQDSDFCMKYKEINPYYYTVALCPHCGYAASENLFLKLTEQQITEFKMLLKNYHVLVDFSGERTCDQAIIAIKIAIYYAEQLNLGKGNLANLYLKLAWLYREKRDRIQELYSLEKALENFETILERDTGMNTNMDPITLEYLVAELKRRTSRIDEALRAFGKVMNKRELKRNARLTDFCQTSIRALKLLNDAK